MVRYIPPPGLSIAEVLKIKFGEKIGLTLEEVHNLFAGNTEITDELAQKVEDVLGMPKHYLLSLERQYRDFIISHDPQ